MRDVMLLMRIQAYRFCGINALLHSRDKKLRRKAMASLGIGLLLATMAVVYSTMFSAMFRDLGIIEIIPQFLAMAVSGVALVITLTKGPELIFGGRDTESLRAMPVHTGAIVGSRLLGIFLPAWGVMLLAFVPAGVFYAASAGAMSAMRMILLSLLVPLMPMSLALLAGTLVARVTIRMRHRALLSAVLSVLLLIAILFATLFGSMAMSSAGQSGTMERAVIGLLLSGPGAILTGIYPPADWLMRGAQGSLRDALLLCGTGVLCVAIACMAATWRFGHIADSLSARQTTGAKGHVTRPVSPMRALLRKERARYTSSAIYMMNTAFAWVMYAALAVALCIGVSNLPIPQEARGIIDEVMARFAAFLPFIPAMLAGMGATTACSISMEGRHMDILRAAPVRKRDWLGAKLWMSLSMAVPVILLLGTIVALWLRLPISDALLLIVVPMTSSLFAGVLGLLLNQRFPRFDWNQEVQAVKNGLSVLLTLLIVVLLHGGALALAVKLSAPYTVLVVLAAAQTVLSAAGFAFACRGSVMSV